MIFPKPATLPDSAIPLFMMTDDYLADTVKALRHIKAYADTLHVYSPGNSECLRISPISELKTKTASAIYHPIIGTFNTAQVKIDAKDLYNAVNGIKQLKLDYDTTVYIHTNEDNDNGALYFETGDQLTAIPVIPYEHDALDDYRALAIGMDVQGTILPVLSRLNKEMDKSDRVQIQFSTDISGNDRFPDIILNGNKIGHLQVNPDYTIERECYELDYDTIKFLLKGIKRHTTTKRSVMGKHKNVAAQLGLVMFHGRLCLSLVNSTEKHEITDYYILQNPRPIKAPAIETQYYFGDDITDAIEQNGTAAPHTGICEIIGNTLHITMPDHTIIYERNGKDIYRAILRDGHKEYTHIVNGFYFTDDTSRHNEQFYNTCRRYIQDNVKIAYPDKPQGNNESPSTQASTGWQDIQIGERHNYELAYGVGIAKLQRNGTEYRYTTYSNDTWQPLPAQVNAIWDVITVNSSKTGNYLSGSTQVIEPVNHNQPSPNIDEYKTAMAANAAYALSLLDNTPLPHTPKRI